MVLVPHEKALMSPSMVIAGRRVPGRLPHSVTSTTAFSVAPSIEQRSSTLAKNPTPSFAPASH